jgi:hypothetical protein
MASPFRYQYRKSSDTCRRLEKAKRKLPSISEHRRRNTGTQRRYPHNPYYRNEEIELNAKTTAVTRKQTSPIRKHWTQKTKRRGIAFIQWLRPLAGLTQNHDTQYAERQNKISCHQRICGRHHSVHHQRWRSKVRACGALTGATLNV